jgi:malto-oligosyltrehalose trehalohydrolase
VHHALHTAATGEAIAYYGEYYRDTEKLGRALAEGFAFQGEMMSYLGSRRGEPSAQLPPTCFIAFIQNHDQVGNRAFGERLGSLAAAAALRAAAAVYLLLPQIPMLFMGEEWNAREPFSFFCDFGGELGELVRQGRQKEFAKFLEFEDSSMIERIPDPQAPETFGAAKLQWQRVANCEEREWLRLYRELLALRRRHIVPLLRHMGGNSGRYEVKGQNAVLVRWALPERKSLMLAANLSSAAVKNFPAASSGLVLWQQGEHGAEGELGPWAVKWWIEEGGCVSEWPIGG